MALAVSAALISLPVFLVFLFGAIITGRWEYACWGYFVSEIILVYMIHLVYKNSNGNTE